jgi:DNA-binding transcriptional LysR family regulator
LDGDGERAVHVTGNMEANSLDALKLAAALGQGLILLPDFLVMDEIKSGRLLAVLTEFASMEAPIHAAYPHRQHLSTNVRTFVDLLVKHARRQQLASGQLKIVPPLTAAVDSQDSAPFDGLNRKPAQQHIRPLA